MNQRCSIRNNDDDRLVESNRNRDLGIDQTGGRVNRTGRVDRTGGVDQTGNPEYNQIHDELDWLS